MNKSKRQDRWRRNIALAFIIPVVILGFVAHIWGAVSSNVPAVKAVNHQIQPMNITDTVYALVVNSSTGLIAIADTGITGGAFGFIKFNASDSTWQFSVDSGGTWSNFNAGASQSDIGDTATVLRAEIGAAGGGDITGAIAGNGISLANASGPGDITIAGNFTYFRNWIDTLNQVKIPNSDSTTYAKGFRVHNTTDPTTNGQAIWDGNDFYLKVGTGGGFTILRQTPDSSATAGNISATALGAVAARNSGANGYVPVYRPGEDSLVVWEAQSSGGISTVKERGSSIATSVTSVNFKSNTGWDITDDGSGEVGVAYDFTADPILVAAGEISGIVPVANGGTGRASWTVGTIPTGNGTSAMTPVGPLDNDGEILIGQDGSLPLVNTITESGGVTVTNGSGSITLGTDYTGDPIDLDNGDGEVTGSLDPANGGTGLTSITDHAVMVGSGIGAVTPIALTNGQILIGYTGADPSAATLTDGTGISITEGAGSITVSATLGTYVDSTEIPAGAVSLSDIDADPGTEGQVLTVTSGTPTWETPSADIWSEGTNGDSALTFWSPASGDSIVVSIDTDTGFVDFPGKHIKWGHPALVQIDSAVVYDSLWVGTGDSVPVTSAFIDSIRNDEFGPAAGSGVTLANVYDQFDPGYVDTTEATSSDSIHIVKADTATYDADGNTITTYYSATTHNHSGIYIGDSTGTVTGANLLDKTVGTNDIANGAIADSLLDLGTDADNFNMLDMYGPTANRLWYSATGGAMTALAAGTEGQILKKGATNPEWGSETDPTLTDDNAVTIGNSGADDITLSFNNPDGEETITYNSSALDAFLFSRGINILSGNLGLVASATVDGVDISALNTDLAADTASWNVAGDTMTSDTGIASEGEVNDAIDSAATANGWGAPSAESSFVKITADSAHIGIVNSDTVNGAMGVYDTLVVNDYLTLPANAITQIMINDNAVDYASIVNQTIKGDDIDSTSENFVFDGAYHVTSATEDSAYATIQFVRDSATASVPVSDSTAGDVDTTGTQIAAALADRLTELTVSDSIDVKVSDSSSADVDTTGTQIAAALADRATPAELGDSLSYYLRKLDAIFYGDVTTYGQLNMRNNSSDWDTGAYFETSIPILEANPDSFGLGFGWASYPLQTEITDTLCDNYEVYPQYREFYHTRVTEYTGYFGADSGWTYGYTGKVVKQGYKAKYWAAISYGDSCTGLNTEYSVITTSNDFVNWEKPFYIDEDDDTVWAGNNSPIIVDDSIDANEHGICNGCSDPALAPDYDGGLLCLTRIGLKESLPPTYVDSVNVVTFIVNKSSNGIIWYDDGACDKNEDYYRVFSDSVKFGWYSPSISLDTGAYVIYAIKDTSSASNTPLMLARIVHDTLFQSWSDTADGWGTTYDTCTLVGLPAGYGIWHQDTKKVGDEWHCWALVDSLQGGDGCCSGSKQGLYFGKSADGLTFYFHGDPVFGERDDYQYMSSGVYRSSGVPTNFGNCWGYKMLLTGTGGYDDGGGFHTFPATVKFKEKSNIKYVYRPLSVSYGLNQDPTPLIDYGLFDSSYVADRRIRTSKEISPFNGTSLNMGYDSTWFTRTGALQDTLGLGTFMEKAYTLDSLIFVLKASDSTGTATDPKIDAWRLYGPRTGQIYADSSYLYSSDDIKADSSGFYTYRMDVTDIDWPAGSQMAMLINLSVRSGQWFIVNNVIAVLKDED